MNHRRRPARPATRRSQFSARREYHESLNPKSGETYYLAPGSYFYGSLNLWKVSGVKVLGRGTIIYEGTQDPNSDEGWMQKPDWHCIGALEAHNVEIDGLTCIVRARTWSIQMKDTTGFVYNDLRVIGGNPGNANQDGMDWLGGGDALVRDAFLRASDDDLAMQGNWDGYTDADMLRPGHDVQNITVENSELSTSISNIVRAAWPRKIFNSRNFTLRDSDILHGGIGACGQTFGVLGLWGANGAKGDHSNYTFENLWLDNWYSLVQIEHEEPSVHGVTLQEHLGARSAAARHVHHHRRCHRRDLRQCEVRPEPRHQRRRTAADYRRTELRQPKFPTPTGPVAHFTVSPPVFGPGDTVTFSADASPHTSYTWLFGDGTEAHGRHVKHKFPDALGTALDGSNGAGRFRVLLQAEDNQDAPGLGSAGSGGRRQVARCIPNRRTDGSRPHLAHLPRHVDRAARPRQPDSYLQRRVAQPTRRLEGLHALRRRHGTASSTFLPMAATPFT